MNASEWVSDQTRDNRPLQWIVSDDTGMSSKAIWAHMIGVSPEWKGHYDHPLDGGDLGRCIRLLRIMPEWAARMPEMAVRSKEWAALIVRWDDLLAAYALWEVAAASKRTARIGLASEDLYDLMRSILDPVRRRRRA